MALPKIDAPTFMVELPSTGQQVKYRPFLVREQKRLLIAMGGDEQQKTQAVKETVAACVEGIDVESLPYFDLEFLFLQLRMRSVGETVDLILTCAECGDTQNAVLDLQDVVVTKPEGHETEFELGNGLLVTMKAPSIDIMTEMRASATTDDIIRLIASSIQTIWKGDELYDTRDYSITDLIEFVEGLEPANLEKLSTFFQTLPVLRHTLDYKCKSCGAENVAVMEGLQGFFG